MFLAFKSECTTCNSQEGDAGCLLVQLEGKACITYLMSKASWVCSTGGAACHGSSPLTLLACRNTSPRAMSIARDLPCLQWQACCQAAANPEGGGYQAPRDSYNVQHTSQRGRQRSRAAASMAAWLPSLNIFTVLSAAEVTHAPQGAPIADQLPALPSSWR